MTILPLPDYFTYLFFYDNTLLIEILDSLICCLESGLEDAMNRNKLQEIVDYMQYLVLVCSPKL